MIEEPNIVVNGVLLTSAQSATVRVALSLFLGDMVRDEALGTEPTGRAISQGYAAAATEVFKLMGLFR